jgi:hypothetical protein
MLTRTCRGSAAAPTHVRPRTGSGTGTGPAATATATARGPFNGRGSQALLNRIRHAHTKGARHFHVSRHLVDKEGRGEGGGGGGGAHCKQDRDSARCATRRGVDTMVRALLPTLLCQSARNTPHGGSP